MPVDVRARRIGRDGVRHDVTDSILKSLRFRHLFGIRRSPRCSQPSVLIDQHVLASQCLARYAR